MLEQQYLNKQIHFVNICNTVNGPGGIKSTDFIEVSLLNLETGGIIETRDIIDNLIIDGKIVSYVTDDFTMHLIGTSHYTEKSLLSKISKFFGNKFEPNISTKCEYYFIIKNPLLVPILVKSIVVETSRLLDPGFKNIWTIPLNDSSITIVNHIYKRIVNKDCLDNDIILIQNVDWKIFQS